MTSVRPRPRRCPEIVEWVRSVLPLLLTHDASCRALSGAYVSAPLSGQVRGLIDSGTETQRCLPRQHRFDEERKENVGETKLYDLRIRVAGCVIVFTLERCDRCLGRSKAMPRLQLWSLVETKSKLERIDSVTSAAPCSSRGCIMWMVK